MHYKHQFSLCQVQEDNAHNYAILDCLGRDQYGDFAALFGFNGCIQQHSGTPNKRAGHLHADH